MVEFNDITLTAGKQRKRGSLSWTASSPASIDFRSRTATRPVSIRLSDLVSLSWCRHFDGFTLRVGLQGGTVIRLSGFAEEALSAITALARTRSLDVKKEQISTKGSNAGQLDMTESSLVFSVDGMTAFELPLHLIAQAVAQSRNEVALELHHDESAAAQQPEALVEMRIYIPEEQKQQTAGEDGDAAAAAAGDDADDDEERETPAQLFARELQLRGDLGAASSTSLASFEKLLFSVPRGKYDVELFPAFLKLTSASYTYKISFRNINKMFLFDLVDAQQHLFVIGLNPPVRQGRTAYPYLVVQFDSSEYLEQKFPAIDERMAEEQFGGLMKPSMKGPSHDVVTRVFKALTKKKVLVPGRSFQSAQSGAASIQCSYKANEGHLFFLEKSFFFLKKPPMYIRHAAIESIEFDRLSTANKRFGMRFHLQDASRQQAELAFTNISRDEFDRIVSFLKDKGISCVTNGEEGGAAGADGTGGGGSSSRRGGRAAAAGDDYADDPYMNRLKAAAADDEEDGSGGGGDARSQQAGGRGGEESDSENDEDFTVGSGEDESGGSDDDDDELESEVDEVDEDDEDERKPSSSRRKQGAPAASKGEKKSRARQRERHDGEQDDDEAQGGRSGKKGGKAKAGGGARAVSGYSLYAKATRPLLMIEQPQLGFGDISRLIADKWKTATPAVKADYAQQAAALNDKGRGGKGRQPEVDDDEGEAEEKTAAPTAASRGIKRKQPADSQQESDAPVQEMDLTADDGEPAPGEAEAEAAAMEEKE